MFSKINSMNPPGIKSSANNNPIPKIPQRFVKINGVTKLNPEYIKYRDAQGNGGAAGSISDKALPIVANQEQYAEWSAASETAGYGKVSFAASTETAVKTIHEPRAYQKVGLSPESILAELGKIFARHEAPIGLLNKLVVLTEYDELEFIIDDSGSMGKNSDAKDNLGRVQTRWEEARSRLKEMMEILAYVPAPKFTIRFLNRTNVIQLQRKGEAPELFLHNIYKQLDVAFEQYPEGSTPVRECLEKSFDRGSGKRVVRYFFGDGEPNGGEKAKNDIACLIINRKDPKDNPVTFLSCTNEDDQVEWMKSLEEQAAYCAEYDDFLSEAAEVRSDQGKGLPFTKGFFLIGQLVGAMCPDDIDAMDESIPFTKWTLDNLLGVQTSQEEYRYYFDGFKEAQKMKKIVSDKDAFKANYNWEAHYTALASEKGPSKKIDGVKKFKAKIASY